MSGIQFIWSLLFAVLWGMVLGGIYFGGLWLSVKRVSASPRSVWLVPISFLFRISIVVLGIAWIGEDQQLAMIAAVIGIMITRQFLIAVVNANKNSPDEEKVLS